MKYIVLPLVFCLFSNLTVTAGCIDGNGECLLGTLGRTQHKVVFTDAIDHVLNIPQLGRDPAKFRIVHLGRV